jgi:8-oxo-dGTP diphosphatase
MPEAIVTAPAGARIEVVAAVIFNQRGEFLLAQRPLGKAYAGYWEFPGGKVETGEDTATALARELHEELGIEVTLAYPWITRDFDYEHAAVRLRFFRVLAWSGELHGRERQQFTWQSIHKISVAPLLPANGPILRALELPYAYGITCVGELGRDAFLARLAQSLRDGLRLIQIRERQLTEDELRALSSDVVAMARPYGARVLVNGPVQHAVHAGADGVHLTAARLMAASQRPACDWCGASCHNAAELERACDLGMDFVVLGPVAATPSHPHANTLGWTQFARLIHGYPLPVYALGGLNVEDLDRAWESGAHGVGMLRGAWSGAAYR